MSNYSTNPAVCRVDFFKPSGKWYATEAVTFTKYSKDYALEYAVRDAIATCLKNKYRDMTAVCLEPYHANSHPISLTV